jgi:hypothetical protein
MAFTKAHRPSMLAMLAMLAMLVLALAGCATPQGTPVPVCASDFEPVLPATPRAMTDRPQSIPVECYRVTGNARIEVGFFKPPGPQCLAVESVEVVESPDAVSLELRVGGIIDPLGACPEEELLWSVLVELNTPIQGREVLDAVGSAS